MQIMSKVEAHNGCQTVYSVQFNGKSYFITTYPNSKLLFIETETLRHVGDLVAKNIKKAFREALSA
jgi:hypothetical protein